MPEQSSFKDLLESEREVRKSTILDATVSLFKEKGFHAVGMRDIADRVGISAATIYRYFPGRDDIVLEALIQDINDIEKQLDNVLEAGNITLEDLAIEVVDYFYHNETTFQMMCYFLTSGVVEQEAVRKFNIISEYFLNMFNTKLKSRAIVADALATHAFFASISGVVLTFMHYPGISDKRKREYMHRLALSIIKGVQEVSVPPRQDG